MKCTKCGKFCKDECLNCREITVRVTWKNNHQMMFGDSYKRWEQQFKEYCRYHPELGEPVLFEKSNTLWVSFGGLKWCCFENFESELKKANHDFSLSDFKFKAFEFSK